MENLTWVDEVPEKDRTQFNRREEYESVVRQLRTRVGVWAQLSLVFGEDEHENGKLRMRWRQALLARGCQVRVRGGVVYARYLPEALQWRDDE